MGVPKFYRWISERYPCLSQVVKEFQIPEFDNLYLDMNGIIHICSHPNDSNPHFRITEDKIFSDIFHYIEVLFRIIKPRKVFYMAVDGVAPRAKMNQQRGRRFRSAKEAEELIRKAVIAGEELPKEDRFDSNCITPGTEFMDRLDRQLKYFVNKKIATDPGWQDVTVYFSGHKVPGEGEHKIMDYIRWAKAQPDHDPNTRHCLYGLDADLIMLGLVTHEPHFSLLREEVRFGKRANESRQSSPEAQTFHLLHISLLREYIYHEFESLKGKLPFGYDLEKILDDWILLGFLVGNDFIPHLPDMHINMEILPYLHKKYIQVLPTLPGYLNNGGELNLEALQGYLQALSSFDLETFQDTQTDLRWLAGKSHKGRRKEMPEEEEIDFGFEPFGKKDDAAEMEKLKRDFGIADLQKYFEDADAEEDVPVEDELFMTDFAKHKKQYYQKKLKMEQVNEEQLQGVAFSYVVGLQWILKYYYSGVPSWSWFYPFHYAPFVSDIKEFAHLSIEFEKGDPFLPFEQLMAVLPAASKSLLPKQLQGLMVKETSPILEYYPPDFETDLNGKRQDWEAVVLIPFINEDRLLAAMATHLEGLSAEAKARNTHGPCVWYQLNLSKAEFTYPSPWPEKFPDVLHCRVENKELSLNPHEVDPRNLVKGLCEGVKLDVFFPGFPTLKHVPYRVQFNHWGVKVFQMNSKGESLTLTVEREETDAASGPQQLKKTAKELIGSVCHVGWPHLVEAKVVAVSSSTTKFVGEFNEHNGVKRLNELQLSSQETSTWKAQAEGISQRYHDRMGIALGSVDVLVEVQELQGRQFVSSPSGGKGAVVMVKKFMTETSMFAHQTVVKDIAVHAPEYREKVETVADLYPPQTDVFLLHPSFYGCQGVVERVDMKPYTPAVYVTVRVDPDPEIKEAILNDWSLQDRYLPLGVVAEQVGASSRVIARLTSAIRCEKGSKGSKSQGGKTFIGLNLKFAKRNEELLGYSRYREDRGWTFSDAAVNILKEFKEKFPTVFDYLEQHSSDEVFYEDDLFPNKEDSEQSLNKLREWLKQLPTNGMKSVTCGGEALDERQVMAIERIVDQFREKKQITRELRGRKLDFKYLFRPMEGMGTLAADSRADFYLLDRVINVMPNGAVPYKLKGTVVGIHGSGKSLLYSVVWDEPFLGGVSCCCSPNRGYRIPPHALLNLTYGKSHQQQIVSKPVRNKQQGRQPASSYAAAITASSSSLDDWRRQQGAQQYSPKAHRKKLDEFTDGRTGIPSLDITNDASSTAHAGAQGKGRKPKNSSSASQQPQRSGKSLFDPQSSQQKDATRVAVGKKEQSGAKSSAAANEFAGLMKEMQSLSTKSPQPGPIKTAKSAGSGFPGRSGTQVGSGTQGGSGTQVGSGTQIQNESQVNSGTPVRKGKSYEKTRKSQPKQPLSEEKINVDSLATAASKLDDLMTPVPQLDPPTSSEIPSLHMQTSPSSVPPSTSAQLAESVAVLFKSATASTTQSPTPSAFYQRPHTQPLLAYPPLNYPTYAGPHAPWMMQPYPSLPGPHQPYMHNPGRFPLLPPQGMPQPYPMPHRRAPHMSWSSHPPPPPPSHSPTTRPIGGAMQTARHRNAIPPAGALLPSPLAPAPIPSKAGKHQLRTTATPFIPTAVMRRSATQIRQPEDPKPEADKGTQAGESTENKTEKDVGLVEDEKAHFQLLLDKISAHPPTAVEEEKGRTDDAHEEDTEKVSEEPPPGSGTVCSATDMADTENTTTEDRCELESSDVLSLETVDAERVPPMGGQLLAVGSMEPAVDTDNACMLEEHMWLQETLRDSDGSSAEADLIQFPETETGTSEEQLVVVGGTIFAQMT